MKSKMRGVVFVKGSLRLKLVLVVESDKYYPNIIFTYFKPTYL